MMAEKTNAPLQPLTPALATYRYMQDGDSCKSGVQILTVKCEDTGGGVYLVLRTERWAIDVDDIDRLAATLKHAAAACAGFFTDKPKDAT